MRERPPQPKPYPGDVARQITPPPVVTPGADVAAAPAARRKPRPYPGDVGGDRVRFRREFRDALGRPVTGVVTLLGDGPRVDAPVDGGVLDVALIPGTYRLHATLRTTDGVRYPVRDEVIVTA